MTSKQHRWLSRAASFLLASALLAAVGCGTKKAPTEPDYVLNGEDAQDIAQQVGMIICLDTGGWMAALRTTVDAFHVWSTGPPPPGPVSLLAADSREPAHRTFGTEYACVDTTVAKSAVTYTLKYKFYQDLDQTTFLCPNDSTILSIGAADSAYGSINASWTGGTFQGSFSSHSSFFTQGLDRGSIDLRISGDFDPFHEDELTASFTPIFRGGVQHYQISTLGEYENLPIVKDPQSSQKFPIGGSAFFWVYAQRLKGPAPAEIAQEFEANVTLFFDGTDKARADIIDGAADQPTVYSYLINLQTGVIEALP